MNGITVSRGDSSSARGNRTVLATQHDAKPVWRVPGGPNGAKATRRQQIEKTPWDGEIVSVQPRIRLLRSFDQRHHNYLGYVLFLTGTVAGETRDFSVAVGKAAQQKHSFSAGMTVSGMAQPVADERIEVAEFYKVSGIKVVENDPSRIQTGPRFTGVPPDLETYRSRGHRRLDERTYQSSCLRCIWGCRMPVEMTIDQWNPSNKRYRFETFCYGPKSCPLYRAGPKRKVPGREGMSYTEEDWVDVDATSHRGDDE